MRYKCKLFSSHGVDLESVLIDIGNNDNDLNGENGEEYLWYETEEKGYKSNIEWLLDQIKHIENDETKVDMFLNLWFKHDDYYQDYEYNFDIIETKNGNCYFVSVAVNTYC